MASITKRGTIHNYEIQEYYLPPQFQDLEHLTVWCKTLSVVTAQWFIRNCPNLLSLKSLSFWNATDDEAVALWHEGRGRLPVAVEIDF